MRRWLIGLGVVGLVIAGVFAFALARLDSYLDANRPWLAEQASAAVGRTVSFDELGVSFWGGVGVRVRGLVVGDDPRFSTEPFVRAADARVKVGLISALFGNITVQEVVLEQPEVTAIRTADGFNFDSLGQKNAAPPTEPAPRADDGEPRTPPVIVVALVDMRGGRMRWIDRTAEPVVDMTLDRVDLEVSDFDFAEPVAIDLKAMLPGATEQNLHVEGTVGPVGNPPDFPNAPVALTVDVSGVDVPSLAAMLPPDARLPADVSISGPLDAKAEVQGTLAAFDASGKVDATKAAIGLGGLFAKPAGTTMTAEATGARSTTGDRMEKAVVRLADLEITVAGSLQPGDVPSVDGRVTSNRAKLAPLAAMLPMLAGVDVGGELQFDVAGKGLISEGYVPDLDGSVTLADVAMKLPAAPVGVSGFSGTVALKGKSVTLPPSPVRIGDTQATVGLTVENLEAEKGRLTMTAPAIDLAAFGMKKGDVAQGVAVDAFADASGEAPVATIGLRSSGGNVSGVAYTNLDGRFVRQADGIVDIERMSVGAFDGTVVVTGRLDPRDPAVPRFALKPVVTGLSLAALAQGRAPVEGRVDMTADVTGAGKDPKAVQKTLAGTGNVVVKNGRLRGVNLIDGALGQLVGIPGVTTLIPASVRQKHPGLFAPDETRFDDLHARFRIAAGVLYLPEVRLATSDYSVTGAGQAAFAGPVSFEGRITTSAALTADIVSGVKLARHLKSDSGRIEVPFEVTGTTEKPRVVPEAKYLATALTKTVAEDGEKLIQKGLDALFGGKKKRKGQR